jgi:hypothetical protein
MEYRGFNVVCSRWSTSKMTEDGRRPPGIADLHGRKDLAAGLSVARTSAWNPAIDFEHAVPLGTTADRLSYSSEAHLDQ